MKAEEIRKRIETLTYEKGQAGSDERENFLEKLLEKGYSTRIDHAIREVLEEEYRVDLKDSLYIGRPEYCEIMASGSNRNCFQDRIDSLRPKIANLWKGTGRDDKIYEQTFSAKMKRMKIRNIEEVTKNLTFRLRDLKTWGESEWVDKRIQDYQNELDKLGEEKETLEEEIRLRKE
tara:strand:+ start:4798 stop:5325 length:528 start_codon:yes stop_codon:yes gene_type:complete